MEDLSSFMTPLLNEQGYLKAGILGFAKSGKTYTAMLLACAFKRKMKLKGPIAMLDTEGGSSYVSEAIQALTGAAPLGKRSRSFDDLVKVAQAASRTPETILIADSVTHVWRDVCDSYLKQMNEGRRQRSLPARSKLEFQDWAIVKGKWAEWTDLFLNLPLHIIICGRAGFEYDMEKDKDTGRNEIVKTGTKMVTEKEFGYEPSLLIEMERMEDIRSRPPKVTRRAWVKGDRFSVIDGLSKEFPTIGAKDPKKLEKEADAVWEFFEPHLSRLKPGSYAPIDTECKTDLGLDEAGNTQHHQERREKTILLEEIQAEMLQLWPSQGPADKVAKSKCLNAAFNTGSWTKVESLSILELRVGLEEIRRKGKELVASGVSEAPAKSAGEKDAAGPRGRYSKLPLEPTF